REIEVELRVERVLGWRHIRLFQAVGGHPSSMAEVFAEGRLATTVADAATALEDAEIPYALMGGLAASVYGRPRATDDIDVLVKPTDAKRALDALGAAGFDTEETNPKWIYKATRGGLTVDLMF